MFLKTWISVNGLSPSRRRRGCPPVLSHVAGGGPGRTWVASDDFCVVISPTGRRSRRERWAPMRIRVLATGVAFTSLLVLASIAAAGPCEEQISQILGGIDFPAVPLVDAAD